MTHTCPTRRSSDLDGRGAAGRERRGRGAAARPEPGGDRRRGHAAQIVRIRDFPRGHQRTGGRAAPLYAAHAFVQRLCRKTPADLGAAGPAGECRGGRSEEHTSELQSLMCISYAVFCLKKKKNQQTIKT